MKSLLLSLMIAFGMGALSASAETSRGDPGSYSAKAAKHHARSGKKHAKSGKRHVRKAVKRTRKAHTKSRRARTKAVARVPSAKGGTYANRRARLLPTVRAATPSSIPVKLVDAIISKESRYNVNARGSRGEIGLMQILPSTARGIAHKIGHGSVAALSDAKLRSYLSVPRNNLKFGLDYLSTCHRMAKGNIAATVGCYNAGPGNMWRWGKIKITRAYVNFVRNHMANEG